jgi:hypothetical protein
MSNTVTRVEIKPIDPGALTDESVVFYGSGPLFVSSIYKVSRDDLHTWLVANAYCASGDEYQFTTKDMTPAIGALFLNDI